jgi:hypothetical protein
LAEYELLVDRYEQPIERPKDYQEQKKTSWGKKKSQTLKNQLIVLPNGKDIADVTAGAPEPKSHINLFWERSWEFNSNQKFNGDKGYLGEPSIKTSQKKSKNRELTAEQRQKIRNYQLNAF